jgi:hypothetical protein
MLTVKHIPLYRWIMCIPFFQTEHLLSEFPRTHTHTHTHTHHAQWSTTESQALKNYNKSGNALFGIVIRHWLRRWFMAGKNILLMNLRLPSKAGNFLTSSVTVSLWRRTLLHEVNLGYPFLKKDYFMKIIYLYFYLFIYLFMLYFFSYILHWRRF